MGLQHVTTETLQNGTFNSGTASGTNTYVLTLNPAITAYALYQTFNILFTNSSTSAATLNINGLGAKVIKRNGEKAIKSNDIKAGQVLSLMYDGTDFQIIGRVSTDWSPTALSLGNGITNGSTFGVNSGAGNYLTFSSGSDNEFLINVSLNRNGVIYDGTPIRLELYWMKFGNSGGTVGWELDYAFVNLGDDAYFASDGTETNLVDVTSLANQILTNDSFNAISGPVGSKTLQLTLRRNSTGTGSDSYTGDAEIYGLNLEI